MKPTQLSDVTDYLEEIKNLLELMSANPFKTRAYEKAANTLAKISFEELMTHGVAGTLTSIPSIGKGIAETLTPFLLRGDRSEEATLRSQVSPALFELTKISGLGPKKALVLIDELGISSLGELEYACRENRLIHLKGFGEKLQQKILAGIEFLNRNRGKMRLSEAFPLGESLLKILTDVVRESPHSSMRPLRVSETGELRRRLEVIESISFLVELPMGEQSADTLRKRVEKSVQLWRDERTAELGQTPVEIAYATETEWADELFANTGSQVHVESVRTLPDFAEVNASEVSDTPAQARVDGDARIYLAKGLPWIPPELRETGEELTLARAGHLPELLRWDGIQGVFHLHTNRSDGTATLEQMVEAAAMRGLKYIGISDHSQSAFYAQGLKISTLVEQEKEIQELRRKFPQVRIFWGIESDILADGALDYDDAVLARFDFVIGSIHSRLGMDGPAMTTRLLRALDSPHLDFLGHLTGRLLLGREPYDLDVGAVVEKAAARDIAIEINANPARLDIDWRYGHLLRRENCLVSVNPDAHSTEGYDDVKYGIVVARKALLPESLVLNSRSADEVATWLQRRR